MNRLRFCVCLVKGHEFPLSQDVMYARAKTERGDPRMSRDCERCGVTLNVAPEGE